MTQFRQAEFNLSTATAAVRVGAAKGDDQFFSTLELAPQLGRVIKSEDNQPGRDHVAVISQSLWHSQFNNDANILTRSITLDGNAYRIIGVMPPDVQYPTTASCPTATQAFTTQTSGSRSRSHRRRLLTVKTPTSMPLPD